MPIQTMLGKVEYSALTIGPMQKGDMKIPPKRKAHAVTVRGGKRFKMGRCNTRYKEKQQQFSIIKRFPKNGPCPKATLEKSIITMAPATVRAIPNSLERDIFSIRNKAAAPAAKTGIEGMKIDALVAVVKLSPRMKSIWFKKTPNIPNRARWGKSFSLGNFPSISHANASNSGVAVKTLIPARAKGANLSG